MTLDDYDESADHPGVSSDAQNFAYPGTGRKFKLRRSMSRKEMILEAELKKEESSLRFDRYAQQNILKKLFNKDQPLMDAQDALNTVNGAVLNIQRIIRGKLARKQYTRLEDAKYAIRHLLIFIVYLLLHICYAFSRKSSPDIFYMSDIMEDSIVHEEFPGPPDGGTYIRKTFTDVASIEEFWDYLEGPFATNVFDAECRENLDLNCVGAMHKVNFHVGDVRMRQFRVKSREQVRGSTCSKPTLFDHFSVPSGIMEAPCYDTWTWSSRSSSAYGPMNTSSPEYQAINSSGALSCFQWTDDGYDKDRNRGFLSSSLFMTGGWVWWDSAMGLSTWEEYPRSSGFTCALPVDKDPSQKLALLKNNKWIDTSTRAVIVELGVYNPPTNLVSTMRLFFEFPQTGGVRPYYESYTGMLFGKNDFENYIKSWIFMSFLAFISVYYVLQEFYEIKSQGIKLYSSNIWNWFDIFNYMLFFFCFYLTIVSELDGNALSEVAVSNRQVKSLNEYIDLQILVYRYRSIDYAFSINLVVVFLKLFKYVRASPQLSMITDTLAGSWKSAGSFFLIFFILLVAFALSLWFTYGHLIWQFRTFNDSLYACFLALLGSNSEVFVNDTYQHNRLLGPLLTLGFLFLMSIVSFSMFLAMVGDAYEAAKARGKTKKGLDPLLVQMVLQIRKTRIWLETNACCFCIKDPYEHVYKEGDSLKVKKGKRKLLSREITVLDMMTGKNGADLMSFWELVGVKNSVSSIKFDYLGLFIFSLIFFSARSFFTLRSGYIEKNKRFSKEERSSGH